MKFEVKADRVRTVIRALPGESDGYPPTSRLEVGVALSSVSADRLAVGLSLVYAKQIAGVVEFPREISALTARRVQEFFDSRYVAVGPVRGGALPIPKGSRRVRVSTPSSSTNWAEGGGPSISLSSLSHHEGITYTRDDIAVASNIAFFRHDATAGKVSEWSELGLAVILAELADASVLVHSSAAQDDARLAQLLECVGLGIVAP